MSRYTIHPHAGGVYVVLDNATDRQWACNKTEARIIEFALNTIADGRELAALHSVFTKEPYTAPRIYNGSIEGVAP